MAVSKGKTKGTIDRYSRNASWTPVKMNKKTGCMFLYKAELDQMMTEAEFTKKETCPCNRHEICLKHWFSAGGDFVPHGIFGNVWKHFITSLVEERRMSPTCWRCCRARYNAQASPPQQRKTQPQMAKPPRLRKPVLIYGDEQEGDQLPNTF